MTHWAWATCINQALSCFHSYTVHMLNIALIVCAIKGGQLIPVDLSSFTLSVVMTKVFCKMNKQPVVHRQCWAQQKHQNSLELQAKWLTLGYRCSWFMSVNWQSCFTRWTNIELLIVIVQHSRNTKTVCSRVAKPRLQGQLFHVGQSDVLMTRLLYQIKKHRVVHRRGWAQQEHQKQSVASGRVTKPKLQEQLVKLSQLSVVMTGLFYKMNKHRVAHYRSWAQLKSQCAAWGRVTIEQDISIELKCRSVTLWSELMSLSYLHNKPSTKLLPQLHYAHAKHCTDCMCNQGKTVDSSRLLSLTFECCDDKAVLPDELTSSCASCAQLKKSQINISVQLETDWP